MLFRILLSVWLTGWIVSAFNYGFKTGVTLAGLMLITAVLTWAANEEFNEGGKK